jgi:oligoribonuclease
MADSPPLPLLWLDLETTGLDKQKSKILEVACFVTTPTGEIEEGTEVNWLIYPEQEHLDAMIPFVKDMHTKSGLLDDIRDHGILEEQWLGEFIDYLEMQKAYYGVERLTVAGSGVGPFDLPLLLIQYPEVEQYLTYYVLDIGVIGRFLRLQCGFTFPERKDVNHRAMDDIKDHYAEFLDYQTFVKVSQHSF